jgi:hypothetical protein
VEEAMNYLFLAYADEQQWAALSPAERDAYADACLANNEALRESGHLLAGAALQAGSTVRVQNGTMLLTEGPFVETKTQINGFFVIQARDLNEAIRLASHMPQAQAGAIEVWPMLESNEFRLAWPFSHCKSVVSQL